MKTITIIILFAVMTLTQCFESSKKSNDDSAATPTNISLAFAAEIDGILSHMSFTAASVSSTSITGETVNFAATNSTNSDDVCTWTFSVASFINDIINYNDDQLNFIYGEVNGQFSLKCVADPYTLTRTYAISSMLSNTVNVTYDFKLYTLSDMNIAYIVNYSSSNTISITGAVTINGTPESLNYTGPNNNSTKTALDKNSNVSLGLAAGIDKIVSASLTSPSISLTTANHDFTGTSTNSDGIYTWTFSTSSFNNDSFTYNDDQGTEVNVVLNGQFKISCVNNINTSIRKYTITPLSSNTVVVTYGTDSPYTLSNMNITYTVNYSSNYNVNFFGSVKINGTSQYVYYSGENQN